ncbi:MAG: hypothetical protein AB4911_15280 [Oscillochloridaceae bacterium umkhey_bin13]
MTSLPITRIVLFKHGVGYFERRGPHTGERLELSFPREAMDDVLKSLVALDLGAGQVVGVDFETPEDRATRLARGSIHLSDDRSLLDLLRDLRGRMVRLSLGEGKKTESAVEGLVVGVDYEAEEPLRRAVVSIYNAELRQVRATPIDAIARVELLDDGAAADLAYFLRAAQSEEQRRAATLRLTPGEHDLLVGYIAPAPAWRVSYRLLFEPAQATQDANEQPAFCLLQGWGLFDNQLEEDLEGVSLTLMAGMPVSFRYRLYEPHTPERPLVQDEERTVNAPIAFGAMPPPAPAMAMMDDAAAFGLAERAPAPMMAGAAPRRARFSAEAVAESVQPAASGDERGALFAYSVAHPVSVARGQSAMVPIISQRLPARRELLYNGAKHARHPVASLRLNNGTGLTLERGPVTVLDAGDYAGEAVLPFTRAGGELIIPFAVELGVTITETRGSSRTMVGLRLRNDYLVFEEYDLQTTTYSMSSGLDQTVEVTVEHARRNQYEVAEPRQPDEEGAGLARWRVNCAPQAVTTLKLVERRLVTRHEQVRSLTGAQLESYLKDRLLDATTVQALNEVLTLYRQADEAKTQIQALDKEREQIYAKQRQIQGNLEPLGREGDEGALRQRYVTTLGQLEDRLSTLAEDEQRMRATITKLEEQARLWLKGMGANAGGE